jgi:hypothetical protein
VILALAALYVAVNLYECVQLTRAELKFRREGRQVFTSDYWVGLIILIFVGGPLHLYFLICGKGK